MNENQKRALSRIKRDMLGTPLVFETSGNRLIVLFPTAMGPFPGPERHSRFPRELDLTMAIIESDGTVSSEESRSYRRTGRP